MTPKQKHFVTEWIAALRSGDYKPASGVLQSPTQKGFCCLGVLCDLKNPKRWLHSEDHGFKEIRYRDSKKNSLGEFFGFFGELPEDVQKQAGLVENEGRFLYHKLPEKIRKRLDKVGFDEAAALQKSMSHAKYTFLSSLNDYYVEHKKKPFAIIADILEYGMEHPELDLFVFKGVNEYVLRHSAPTE
jgi:hypothetical protein